MERDRLSDYPIRFINPIVLKDGTLVQLRPIHPDDGEQAANFKSRLSPESIYNRFLGYLPPLSDALIQRFTEVDYKKEMAIVAESSKNLAKEAIAVARLASLDGKKAEFAIIIADDWQGKGLGQILTDYMIKVAVAMNFELLYASYFARNLGMAKILKRNGFQKKSEEDSIVSVELSLEMEDVDFEVDVEF